MADQTSTRHSRRAYYEAPMGAFCAAPPENVLGELVGHSEETVDLEQQNAWSREIEILRQALSELDGHVFLEFVIPRMGRRADALAFLRPVNVVLEFKIGAHTFLQAVRQEVNRNYLPNGYRVLLSRARQRMVIFVPPGSRSDPTRDPSVP